ncbi:MAG: hypothetical protein JNL60_15965 [Bacteroidia bacterium]|nr:hypothetical protein [Bacteroidia bacterium]
METLKKIALCIAVIFSSTLAYSQSDSLGLPGDNLDLEAVLSIFKNSSSVEEFEKKLNSASDKVNNLDLNGDGQVDYLRVVESGKDDFRSIVIQAPISKTESQDVAVIEIEKRGEKTAHIQIVGDESLYGKDYIIEPRDQKSTAQKSATSNDDAYASSSEKSERRSNNDYDDNGSGGSNVTIVNVWGWPAVSYMYAPSYVFWVSPWYWGYWPGWYSPWAPYGYYYYHRAWIGYNYGFYGYRTHYYRFPHVHHHYYSRRVTSPYVQKTAPTYQRRQAVTSNPNRTRINRSGNGASGTNRVSDNRKREQAQPANRGGSERVKTGENRVTRPSPSGNTRVNRGNPESHRVKSGSNRVQQSPANRQSGTMQRGGGSPGGSNRSGNQGGGGGNSGGGGGNRGGGGGHRR